MNAAPNTVFAESAVNAEAHSRKVVWSWQRICSSGFVPAGGAQNGWNFRRENTARNDFESRTLREQRDCLIDDKKVAFPPCKLGYGVDDSPKLNLSGAVDSDIKRPGFSS